MQQKLRVLILILALSFVNPGDALASGFAGAGMGLRMQESSNGVEFENKNLGRIFGGHISRNYSLLGEFNFSTDKSTGAGNIRVTHKEQELIFWGRMHALHVGKVSAFLGMALGARQDQVRVELEDQVEESKGKLRPLTGITIGAMLRLTEFYSELGLRSYYRHETTPTYSYEASLLFGWLF